MAKLSFVILTQTSAMVLDDRVLVKIITQYDIYDSLSKRLFTCWIERKPACGGPVGGEWTGNMFCIEESRFRLLTPWNIILFLLVVLRRLVVLVANPSWLSISQLVASVCPCNRIVFYFFVRLQRCPCLGFLGEPVHRSRFSPGVVCNTFSIFFAD